MALHKVTHSTPNILTAPNDQEFQNFSHLPTALLIECLLLDFLCFMGERAMRSGCDGNSSFQRMIISLGKETGPLHMYKPSFQAH